MIVIYFQLTITKSFLTQRTQSVVTEGASSPPAVTTSGVPQGTVLGPLLFYDRRTETKEERKRTRTTKRYTSNSLKLVEEVTPQILFLDTKPFVISTDELFQEKKTTTLC